MIFNQCDECSGTGYCQKCAGQGCQYCMQGKCIDCEGWGNFKISDYTPQGGVPWVETEEAIQRAIDRNWDRVKRLQR